MKEWGDRSREEKDAAREVFQRVVTAQFRITPESMVWSTAGKPLDDAFRKLVRDLPRLVLLFLNDVFDKHYTGEEEILFDTVEGVTWEWDGSEYRQVLDRVFGVASEENVEYYHLEFQVTPDANLGYQFIQYDTAAAIATAQVDEHANGTITYPNSAVIYLQPPESLQGDIEIIMQFPDSEITHTIKVVRPTNYTLDEMLQEEHLLLLPFYPLRWETDLNA